jgi:hypothetical protein
MGRQHRHHTNGARRRSTVGSLALAGVATVALAACGGDDESSVGDTAALEPAVTQMAGDDTAGGDQIELGATAEAAPGEAASGDVAPGQVVLGTIGRDVIVEMRVSMSSDDIQRSVAAITARVAALGGGVASSDVDYGDPAIDEPGGYAVLVVKVPPAAVPDLVAGLDDAGTVRSVGQSAQDVTEQLVDLDIRIENARASVANVREFMDRTEDLSELVTLEAELSRRQTELERLEAQQRNLSERVALATVTIEIVPTASVPEPDTDDGGIGDAFGDGWRAFVAVIYGVILVGAVLAPFLVVGLVATLVLWWLVRRPRRAGPIGDERTAETVTGGAAERDETPTPTG